MLQEAVIVAASLPACMFHTAWSKNAAHNSTIQCGKNANCTTHAFCCKMHDEPKCNATSGENCEKDGFFHWEYSRYIWLVVSLVITSVSWVIIYVVYKRQEQRQRLIAANQPVSFPTTMAQPGMVNMTATNAYLPPASNLNQPPRESYQPQPPPPQTQFGMFGNTIPQAPQT